MFIQALLLSLVSVTSAISIDRRAAISEFTSSPLGLSWPPTRGFSASSAQKAPCGGFSAGSRVDYPFTGGDISLTSRTLVDSVNVMWTNETDPTRFHAFSTYADTLKELGAGHYCQPAPDFTSLGLKEGDDVTIMIMYQLNGTETYYYDCADINLVPTIGFVASQSYMCGNYTSTLEVASDDESLHLNSNGESAVASSSTPTGAATSQATAASSSEASLSNSGLSAGAGGGIGAGVTIIVLALLGAAAYILGYVRFGKKKSIVFPDHASDSTGLPVKAAQF
ncbi:uncharacterized protein IL334_001341 [Kwoniella shivajii]|uniref:Copper acquisition factor BIM1-like domain-containing protein n=1 Tax=Kwoniella shivajii TaxID=564305 RepID=A0ABZ1CSS6_9TREE|nr:hypothetical protein IL334_001341 [Kwoniella shivajii]